MWNDMKKTIKKCEVCGIEFEANRPNSKYHSAECRKIGVSKKQAQADAARRERESIRRKQKKSKKNTIVDIVIEAKKEGLSYGEYVAKMGL